MSFVNDVQLMMHGFGDCRKPLIETATLIESVVHQQMCSLLHQATDISEMRGSTRGIGPEDILFIIRKDHLKIQRMLNYMGVRDLYQRTSALTSGGASKDLTDLNAENENSRKRICTSFLQSLDQIGEFEAICTGALVDPVRSDRNARLDAMTQGMSAHRYKEYCEARRASFCPRLRVSKFKEWLLGQGNEEIKLSQHVLEMLNFLAYETVAQLVDLAILVRRDSKGRKSDLSRFESSTVLNPDYPSIQIQQGGSLFASSVDGSKDSRVGMDPISPSEVREAIRRFWSNNSVLAPFSKISSPIDTRLLAG